MTRPDSLLFKPLYIRGVFREISGEIKKLFFMGRLKVGDKLPSGADLAIRFRVSRQTMRGRRDPVEALMAADGGS